MKNHVIKFLCVQMVVLSMVTGLCGCGFKASAYASTKEATKKEIDLDNTTAYAFDEEGITLYLPPEYLDTKGIIEYSATDLTYGDGLYLIEATYRGMTPEDVEKLMENPTEEGTAKYRNSTAMLFGIIGIDKNRNASDIVSIVNAQLLEYGADEDSLLKESDITEVTTYEDCTYYKAKLPEENNYDNLEPEFQEEFDLLLSYADSIIENADYHEALGMFPGVVGSKVSFETTDIDGNPITSDEIFAKNDITMVNVWATWCGWCVKELPELEEINNRLAEKNCAIVGLLGDGMNDGAIEDAKALLDDAGCTYTCIMPFDGWQDQFNMDNGWPTSFLVDSTGTIVAAPIVGAQVKKYEEAVEKALAGKTDESYNDPGYNSVKNNEGAYRIFVVDNDSKPVEGTMIQFCSDDTCNMGATDKDGIATFEKPEGVYEVHVLKAPKGYKANDDVYLTINEYSDLTIVLEKE